MFAFVVFDLVFQSLKLSILCRRLSGDVKP